jgi:hypothetical protein
MNREKYQVYIINKSFLCEKKKMSLLVLDLDQTLIDGDHDRPGLEEFLIFCCDKFDYLSIWTRASKMWVDIILKQSILRKFKERFLFIWNKDQCSYMEPGIVYKPLHKIWSNDEYRTLGIKRTNTWILDDNPENAIRNFSNLILIKPFYEDTPLEESINELMRIIRIISKISADQCC